MLLYIFLLGPAIIQTQNITNMCQAYRNLCLNGRCIPMPGVGYRCECNMGFRLDGRGECVGKIHQVPLVPSLKWTTVKKVAGIVLLFR